MYQQIVNPETGRKVNIFSKLGQQILNNYSLQMGGASLASTNCVEKGNCRGAGKRCRKKDTGCEYIPKAQASARGVDKYGCYQCSESETDEDPTHNTWQEHVDVDGSLYYYNPKTNEQVYEKPADYIPDGKESERALEAAENKREHESYSHDEVVEHSLKTRATVFSVELEESTEDKLIGIIEELEGELGYVGSAHEGRQLTKQIEEFKSKLIDLRGYYKIEELLEKAPHKKVLDKFDIAGYECFQPDVVEEYDYVNAKTIKCAFDEESHSRDMSNKEIRHRENEAMKKRYFNEIKEQLDQQGFQYEDGDLVENLAQSGYRTGGVYIIKTNLETGLLYVDDLARDMDDYGHVGHGFSLGPNRPFCYWNNARFPNAYWHSEPLPEPLESKYWHPIVKEDLDEFTETRKRYDGSTYSVTFCHYELGWGVLRFPGNKAQVMKFLNDQKADETELLYFQAVGDCSDGGTELAELSDQFYYIEGVTDQGY